MEIVISRRRIIGLVVVVVIIVAGAFLINRLLYHSPQVFMPNEVNKTASDMGTVTLEIKNPDKGSQNVKVNLALPATVAQVLDQAEKEHSLGYKARDYGGDKGKVVESLVGLENNQKADQYWQFSVNGQTSSSGIGDTVVKSWDIITWQYEGIKSDK